MKYKIYLDDIRIPNDGTWTIVRDYNQFVDTVEKIGLENIEVISLDHDLSDSAMEEYFRNVRNNREINYENIIEKTGYDCSKWLVNYSMDKNIPLPQIYVHSQNPCGCHNIISYINGFLSFNNMEETCTISRIPHTYINEI